MIGRRGPDREPVPVIPGTPGAELRATARIDQALAVLDEGLRTHQGSKQLCDVLLDARNALQGR